LTTDARLSRVRSSIAVNFFGHAAVASWYRASPAFVLGAMLPDFFSILRIKGGPQSDADVGAGVELHHATDAAFHDSEAFLTLTRAGNAALGSAGVPRGPARATAHIGVELLLDEILGTAPQHREAYAAALALTPGGPLPVELGAAADVERLTTLLERLRQREAPSLPLDSERLALRIHRMLHGRARLELPSEQVARVRDWLSSALPRVQSLSDGLLAELRAKLDPRWRNALGTSD
jgi:hypothetical protein